MVGPGAVGGTMKDASLTASTSQETFTTRERRERDMASVARDHRRSERTKATDLRSHIPRIALHQPFTECAP